jgi:hypothetical protein
MTNQTPLWPTNISQSHLQVSCLVDSDLISFVKALATALAKLYNHFPYLPQNQYIFIDQVNWRFEHLLCAKIYADQDNIKFRTHVMMAKFIARISDYTEQT